MPFAAECCGGHSLIAAFLLAWWAIHSSEWRGIVKTPHPNPLSYGKLRPAKRRTLASECLLWACSPGRRTPRPCPLHSRPRHHLVQWLVNSPADWGPKREGHPAHVCSEQRSTQGSITKAFHGRRKEMLSSAFLCEGIRPASRTITPSPLPSFDTTGVLQ